MKREIQDFVTITQGKSGNIKITHDISNESNIYAFLRSLGFRRSRINKKWVYYRRVGQKITASVLREVKDAFLDFLKDEENYSLPKNVTKEQILEWYYSKSPIKQNGLFFHHLEDELSDFESHQLRMEIDLDYKREVSIQNVLDFFQANGFQKVVDKKSHFSKDADLYFKKVNSGRYLIFNHFNKGKPNLAGFDCCNAQFQKESEIGLKEPSEMEHIASSFDLQRDFHLIESYL